MNKSELPPKYLGAGGSLYELEICNETSYTIATYEHIPRKDDSYFVSVIGKGECDAKLKMLGLLIKEGLL